MLQLIWSHGWGFNATFFTPLLRALPEYEHFVIDQGYFDDEPLRRPKLNQSKLIIGIGHSLGFAKLFDLPFSYESVISLGGFTRFCQGSDFPAGTPKRIVHRMLERFQCYPKQVLQDFYRSCGFTQGYNHPSYLNLERLSTDLRRLLQLDIAIPAINCLAVAGTNDQICPPPQQQAMFNAAQFIEGNHIFPVVDLGKTASLIRHFVNQVRYERSN